jgi:hypothetical protein
LGARKKGKARKEGAHLVRKHPERIDVALQCHRELDVGRAHCVYCVRGGGGAQRSVHELRRQPPRAVDPVEAPVGRLRDGGDADVGEERGAGGGDEYT